MNRNEEHATARRGLSAVESLAEHAGVDVGVALRHLQNNTARVLVEKRGHARRRRSARSGLSLVEALYALQEKWEPSP
jgi:hypothetical protein